MIDASNSLSHATSTNFDSVISVLEIVVVIEMPLVVIVEEATSDCGVTSIHQIVRARYWYL